MLEMSYIPSGLNPADYYSRKLTRSDAILSATSWGVVQEEFGGPSGHNFDLMAYDSNVQHDLKGAPLPHFTPFLTPCSAGVNLLHQDLSICDGITVNAYVFPAFSLIGPLLRFLRSQRATVTFMAPRLSPLPVWWPIINSMSKKKVLIACKGSTYTILFPKKQGFQLGELPFELWAFRVDPTV